MHVKFTRPSSSCIQKVLKLVIELGFGFSPHKIQNCTLHTLHLCFCNLRESRLCVQMLFPSLPVSLLNFTIQRILKFLVSKYYSKFKLTNVFLLSTLENFRFLFKLQSCSKIFQLKNESDIRSWEKFEFRGSNYLMVRY